MPSADKLIDTIENSHPSDWERFEIDWNARDPNSNAGLMAVYQPDVQLRIEQGKSLQEGYASDWSDKYANSDDNESYRFWVMYGESPIDYVSLVAVDGYAAFIKTPNLPQNSGGSHTISSYGDTIGAAVSHSYDLYQEKLQIGGIQVV